MRNIYKLTPELEKCRVIGGLGVHALLVGLVMSQMTNLLGLSLVLCGIGVVAVTKVLHYLFKH